MLSISPSIKGYRAITVWGDPVRLEFETILITTKSLFRKDTAIADQHI
jgi:hypothetical protein